MFKKFFRNYVFEILIALAFVFLAVIIGSYVWSIGYLISNVSDASNSQAANGQAPQFNIDAAAKLDYKGVLPQQ